MDKFQEQYAKDLKELRELVEKKSQDPLDAEKIEKINNSLNSLEEKNQELVKKIAKKEAEEEEFKKTLDAFEKRLNNPDAGKSNDTISLEKKHFDLLIKKGSKNLTTEEVKYLRTDDNENGGYLVPVDYVNEIIKDLVEITPFRNYARIITTSRNEVQLSKRSSTPTVYWVEEGGSYTETQSKYGAEKIPTHKISCYVDITREMLSDSSFNIQNEIMSDVAEQFSYAEGNAFISGNSVAKPEGILTNSSVGAYASGIADALAGDPFFEIQGEFKTGYVVNNRLAWILNAKTLWQNIRTLKTGDGDYILESGMKLGVPNMIAGRPYIISPDMPDVAAGTYPVALGDFKSAYYIVEKSSMNMLRDDFTQATSGKVRFVFERRIGGQVVKPEAIKKMKVAASI